MPRKRFKRIVFLTIIKPFIIILTNMTNHGNQLVIVLFARLAAVQPPQYTVLLSRLTKVSVINKKSFNTLTEGFIAVLYIRNPFPPFLQKAWGMMQ